MIYQLHGLILFKHQHSSPNSSRIMHTAHLQPSNRLSDCVLSCRYAGRQLLLFFESVTIRCHAPAHLALCLLRSAVTMATDHGVCKEMGTHFQVRQLQGPRGLVTRKLQCALSASSCSMPLT